jgi:rod shape determining protein RodA
LRNPRSEDIILSRDPKSTKGIQQFEWKTGNFFLEFFEEHQQKRILSFLYPESVSKDERHQSYQSEITVGSGGFWGKGYGESTQTKFKYLPEHHTDFVFPVWAEEWGFVGCLLMLCVFFFWLVQMINVASIARDRFGILLAVGLVAMTFWHVVINIGMVIGLAPVVGLTLPLWSYGGSSVLATMASVGLLMSISYWRHEF